MTFWADPDNPDVVIFKLECDQAKAVILESALGGYLASDACGAKLVGTRLEAAQPDGFLLHIDMLPPELEPVAQDFIDGFLDQ